MPLAKRQHIIFQLKQRLHCLQQIFFCNHRMHIIKECLYIFRNFNGMSIVSGFVSPAQEWNEIFNDIY